jgi:hypothetical protein
MAAISAPSGPIIDPLDLDRYMGQDPDQSPETMLSDLDQIYDLIRLNQPISLAQIDRFWIMVPHS